jgi:hypothetical protein
MSKTRRIKTRYFLLLNVLVNSCVVAVKTEITDIHKYIISTDMLVMGKGKINRRQRFSKIPGQRAIQN